MSHRVIAIAGKGGVGKTSISAILAGELVKQGRCKALIVDADPSGGLGMALGLSVRRSINQLRVDTIQEIKKKTIDDRDLSKQLDFILMDALNEKANLAFIAVGRPEEVGCYCSVNNLLREAIETLSIKFDVTVIDAEAGVEQINRKVVGSVDHLFLVADSSVKAITVAESIDTVFSRINRSGRTDLILNRIESPEQADAIATRTHLNVLGWIPEDSTIRKYDLEERSFFDLPACPAANAVIAIVEKTGILTGIGLQAGPMTANDT
ncbi:MAG: AAA family ATPase [Deltaproteobacteria bacterium]|nr:AAA family ATPase [Deltaproteobacteria bacterium]